jgi:hypothetical protein
MIETPVRDWLGRFERANSLAARILWRYELGMSIVSARKRGRPPSDTEPVNVRMDRPLLNALDHWIAQQEDAPSRPEAVRRILSSVLEA